MSFRNILKVFDQSSSEDREAGIHWYRRAQSDALVLPVNLITASAVIAALSPGLRWERNIEAARRVIVDQSLVGLGVRWYANVAKGRRIVLGESPDVVLKGNKVRAFWQCILHGGQSEHVCVDGHAYSIYAGKRLTLDDIPRLANYRYNRIARAYVRAGKAVGISGSSMQAITWTTWRRIHGVSVELSESV